MKQFNLFLATFLALLMPSILVAQNCSTQLPFGQLSEGAEYTHSLSLQSRGGTNTDSAWYSFTVPSTGYVTISSCDVAGSPEDTRLFLFDGNTCANLSLVATSDNDCGFAALLNDRKVFNTKTYYLLWDNKSTSAPLNFNISVKYVSEATYNANRPANDNICSATAISVDDTLTNQSNEYASVQGVAEFALGGDPGLQTVWSPDFNVHNSVWYTFVAPASGAAGIELTGTAGIWDAQLAVFSGTCTDFSSLDFVGASEAGKTNDPSINLFSLIAGETYYILIDGYGTESGDFDISVKNIDLRSPYTILFNPDTVVSSPFTAFACPGYSNFALEAELLVAADSSEIDGIIVNNAYDAWYLDALTEYLATLEWTLNDASGTNDYASDNNLSAGTYTATFTDNFRPAWSADFTFVEETRDPLVVTISEIAQPGCAGASGSIDFDIAGGFTFNATGITYMDKDVLAYYKFASLTAGTAALDGASLNPVFGSQDDFHTDLYEGHYRLIVEDACGNFDSTDFTMNDPELVTLVASVDTTIHPYCDGSATGEIEVSAVGGENSPYEYFYYRADTLTTMAPDTLVYSAAIAGADTAVYKTADQGWYRVVIYDGCTQFDTVYTQVVDRGLDMLMVAATVNNPTSYAAMDGSVTLNVTGGQSDYRSAWFLNGEFLEDLSNELSVTGLAQGEYQIYVEDSCANVGSWDTTFVMLAPLANDEPCDAITIAEGDSLTLFSNAGATTATGESALNIPTDADEGFNGWEEKNIQSSVWFSFEAPASGAVAISTELYEVLGNLSFDPQVAVFSADNCADFGTFQYLAANDDVTSGTVNNSYLETYCLTPGATYYILVDGFAGIGQEGMFNIYIEEIELDPLTVLWSKTNETCVDLGTISIDSIGGGVYMNGPEDFTYTVNLNNGDSIISELVPGYQNILFEDLAPGIYNLTVADTCGVVFDMDITIEEYDAGALTIVPTVTKPTCPMGTDGVIEIAYSNGVGGYSTYFEKLPLGTRTGSTQTGDTIVYSFDATGDDIDAGSYIFYVIDDCGNQKQFEVLVQDPVYSALTASHTSVDPTCTGGNDGTFTIEFAGGSGQYYVSVIEATVSEPVIQGIADSLVSGTSFTVSDLVAANYYYVVKDFCLAPDTAAADTVKIIDPIFDPFSLDITSTVNPSDSGSADGSFTFVVEDGATPYTTYAMTLNPADSSIVDTLSIVSSSVTGLKAGLYQVETTDNCGFTFTEIFELKNPPSNDDACDAFAIAVGDSRTWSNVAATVQANEDEDIDLPVNETCLGSQGWCINDSINASVWYKVVIPASGAINVEVSSNDFDPQVAVFTATCSDFTSFELLAANDDVSLANNNASVTIGCLTPGTEVYVLIDANVTSSPLNVEGDYTVTVTEVTTGPITIASSIVHPTTEISTDGSINITLTGGYAPFTFAWVDNGVASAVTTKDRSGLVAGTYHVTITDNCGDSVDSLFTLVNSTISYDNVCGAVLIPVDGVNREYTNQGATLEAGELAIEPATDGDCFSNTESKWCSGDGLDASIWFKFYAPASGQATVDLCNGGNNTFDTQLAVYSSNNCANFATFNLVGANDDIQTCNLGSRLDLTGLTPCGLYFVLVDTDDDSDRGIMGIKISDPAKSLNAGDDVSVTLCQEDGDVDLANLLSGNADQGGTFVDVNATGELTGSVLSAGNLAVGVYTFEYRLFATCDNQTTASDVAVITVRVEACVGIIENNNVSFSLYPNPTESIFNISTKKAVAGVDVVVSDLSGKNVYSKTNAFASSKDLAIDLSGLAKGVYAVKLTGEATGAFKVVLQ